ncbi:MAG TPA: hypothetical protein PLA50_00090 [Bacteroidia bacterium]|nr:hypothetical protein [Bacteroidia bacterium]
MTASSTAPDVLHHFSASRLKCWQTCRRQFHYGPMTPAMESELLFLIDDYLEGIAREAWVPSPGQHCAWCDHLDLCRKRFGPPIHP